MSPAKKSPLSGKIQTVLGPIEPDQLGITQTHEHLLIDMNCYFEAPDAASERAWITADVTIENLSGAYRRWNYMPNAVQLFDEKVAIQEVLEFKYAGGNSLMDTTNIGLARDPLALTRISRATGLNVIMGASHYVPASYPADMDKRSEQAITDQIIRDLTVGVVDTGVRSGFIGEVGNFWPTNPTTLKVLRASAHAAIETGAAILIHPGYDPASPPHIMETLTKAGADPKRIIMGHLDIFEYDSKWIKDLAQTGCYMEWDTFGLEDTTVTGGNLTSARIASDVQRMEILEYVISEGFGNKIVIAHDVCTKMQYTRYGGKSYGHILTNIVPRMRKRGFTEKQINAILVDNPKTVLAFK
ncbi:MAG: hypothetical protein FJ312_06350 [SAR202 cluster bacterium]|nr:hypothetical protein [SAR202 cluster bacterium]